jgi:hypothetical protein
VGQGLGGHQAEAVLLGYVVKFYCCTHSFINFLFSFVNQKRGSTTQCV